MIVSVLTQTLKHMTVVGNILKVKHCCSVGKHNPKQLVRNMFLKDCT